MSPLAVEKVPAGFFPSSPSQKKKKMQGITCRAERTARDVVQGCDGRIGTSIAELARGGGGGGLESPRGTWGTVGLGPLRRSVGSGGAEETGGGALGGQESACGTEGAEGGGEGGGVGANRAGLADGGVDGWSEGARCALGALGAGVEVCA